MAATLTVLTGCTTIESTAPDLSELRPDLTPQQAGALQAGYDGRAMQEPTRSGPVAQTGKKVWVISCGQTYQACSILSSSFTDAARNLGWNTNLVDSKADPSVATSLIKQAVAARADGIAVFSLDCPGIISGLKDAKAAGIPVVQYTSIDCDDPAFGGGEKLFTASVNVRGSTSTAEYYRAWGAARAEYLAALLGNKGKVLEIRETSQRTHAYSHEGFVEQMAISCPGCEIVDVPFTFAQVPKEATAVWNSALLKHADAAAVSFSIDSLMGLGLQSALRQSGFRGITAGGEGLNLDLVREGRQTTETPIPYELAAWGLADTLNRVFAGEDPDTLPSEGGGWIFLDAEHNLPAGQMWSPAFDFKGIYTSMWAGRSR
ncbi:sugar ABC transporter substrate-binding protein [Mycolicibacterium goodii]|uniref:sugar ABC transporter substrate-binding protein n=1 Tax=Mycolicibacterium goodii TaxID=134601 RepID=UPI0012FF6E00